MKPCLTLDALFLESCRAHPDRIALTDADGAHRYSALELRVRQWAASVGRLPQGPIALLLANGAPFVSAFFGVLLAGRTVVPLDPRSTEREVRFLLEHCGCAAVIGAFASPPAGCEVLSPDFADEHHREPEISCDSRAPAVVLCTSGSTASPKAVVLTHGNIIANTRSWIDRYQLSQDDVFVTALSLFHSFGMTACMVTSVALAAHLVVGEDAMPNRTLGILERHRATVFVAAASYYGWLLRSNDDRANAFATVRLCLSGACALPRPIAEGFEHRFGRSIIQTYGLTEASPVVTANPPAANHPGTVGTALMGVELRVEDGELLVRGETVMHSYLHNPDATRACMTTDGWLRTGDLASIDKEGYVTIVGRIKDLIVRAGTKIHPDEIEEVLLEHPDVLEASVVGAPDPVFEECPVAFVVVRLGADLNGQALLEFCRERLALHKVPKYVRTLDALPRNPNGKVMKRELRKLLS